MSEDCGRCAYPDCDEEAVRPGSYCPYHLEEALGYEDPYGGYEDPYGDRY